MNKKQLFWIVPLSFVFGLMCGGYFWIPQNLNLVLEIGDNAKSMIDIYNETSERYLEICNEENNQLWEALDITNHNLNDCRDLQVTCFEELYDRPVVKRNGRICE